MRPPSFAMDIFFNWTRIQDITSQYQIKVLSALREGVAFLPHVLGFMAQLPDDQNAIYVNVPTRMLTTCTAVEEFVSEAARSLPKATGRLEAAGFVVLLPREVANEFVDAGPALSLPEFDLGADVVAVLHVEHVFLGFRTWVLEDRRSVGWKLANEGVFTRFPTCLPEGTYGTGAVGSA